MKTLKQLHVFLPFVASLAMIGLAASAEAKDFGQEDLEKVVKELDKVIPENPGFKYPIISKIVDSDQVNAYAGFRKEGDAKQAVMVVYTGLIKKAGSDNRLIRAVVAHELSHLSLGHSLQPQPAAQDLRNLWQRQQEYSADKSGADALVAAGYSKKDMVDMLLFLESQDPRSGDWLGRLVADHADPKARAAEVSGNPDALKALTTFDTALAYEDSRSHLYAQALFALANNQWPALTESLINSGKCSLLYYYDNLPEAVRNSWWRPDFGSLITTPHAAAPQATEVTDQDREAWKDAMTAISKGVEKNPNSLEAEELLALAEVLEPDANKDVITKGTDWFHAHVASTTDVLAKLRYANNEGLGYQRLQDLSKAYSTILSAQKGTDKFNAALGENLGLVTVAERGKEEDLLAANVLLTWLSDTPPNSPRWAIVKKTFDQICGKVGITAKEIQQKPIYLCSVVSLNTSGKDLGILLPVRFYESTLGAPEVATSFDTKYSDLKELKWHGGKITAFTERSNIMRITSYEEGAYLLLKPTDSTSATSIRVKVGMDKAELFALLSEKNTVSKELAKGGDIETWTYFPDLNMGVLVQNDKVSAITVSPVIRA